MLPIPGQDAMRSGTSPSTSSFRTSIVVSIPPSVLIGAAIRAARRNAGPVVTDPLVAALADLASGGNASASLVRAWLLRDRESSLPVTVGGVHA